MKNVKRIGLGTLVLGLAVPALAQDYNGDGFKDLAIGVSGEDIGAISDAGAVVVVYGGPAGLSPFNFPGAQFWHQGLATMPDPAEAGDQFGLSLTSGDFDGNGFDDLAIGVPFEDSAAGTPDSGAVIVIYGSPAGLGTAVRPIQVWYQGVGGIPDVQEAKDRFGWSLAAGDFNLDGTDDLAVGVPFEGMFGCLDVGAVHVIHGSTAFGLSTLVSPPQFWHQGIAGMPGGGTACAENFGFSLAAGNFNGMPQAALAIGVPQDNIGFTSAAGAVNVIYSLPGIGLSLGAPTPAQWWHQDSPGIPDVAENGDDFGYALAAGDFDLNGIDDLAVGAPAEDIGTATNCGMVNVIYGMPAGLTGGFATAVERWHQNVAGVPELNQNTDRFGASLATGRFNPDLADDLAIGIPNESVGALLDAGSLVVVAGMPGVGLSSAAPFPSVLLHQNVPGIPEVAANTEFFATSLAAGDYNGDGIDDLAAGVPLENVGPFSQCGGVNIFGGGPAGPGAAGALFIHQGLAGMPDPAENTDNAGYSVR